MQLRTILMVATTAFLAVSASAEAQVLPRASDDRSPVGTPTIDFREYPRGGPSPRRYPAPRGYPDSRSYREPRREPESRGYRPPIVTQFSAGLYNPGGPSATSTVLGARVGQLVDPQVQLGVMLDWAHKADRVSATFGHETVGGVDLSYEDSRLRGRSDLVPLLAYVQVSGRDTGRPIPYGGLGAGYEFLSMEADRPDGTRFSGSFGGWGWQLWGGVGLSFSNRARLTGELFYNHADLGRDVNVEGRTLRQAASFNGPGVRLGVAWGF